MRSEIVVLGAGAVPRTFGWRHLAAWRQLGLLWKIPVSDHSVRDDVPIPGAVYSAAITGDECSDLETLGRCLQARVATVVFLDRARLVLNDSRASVRLAPVVPPAAKSWQHVFRVNVGHPLAQGLPRQVTVYGPRPDVTPVDPNGGGEVLLWLNDVPIAVYRRPALLVGADPWQLGAPSVPMLYKLLSNWLRHERGRGHHLPEPVAAMRLDDLPTTGEEVRGKAITAALDRRRARTLKRLRRFALRTGARFTLMYASHCRALDGRIVGIANAMPCSIMEIKTGLEQGLFEVGSHGMTHLRDALQPEAPPDGREFADLDEEETERRLRASADEIARVFGIWPETFVAPVWAYRSGVTKRVAGRRFRGVADASYRVESGRCNVLFSAGDEGDYMNLTETFRASPRMLSYGDPDFWRCYGAAGIPIHYVQHSETNWHILRDVLAEDAGSPGTAEGPLLASTSNLGRSRALRAVTMASLIALRGAVDWRSWSLLRRATTGSSIYAFVNAMKAAGYRSILLSELIEFGEKNNRRE